MTSCRATTLVPPLVLDAMALADRLGFSRSCAPEVGCLLRVLVAGVRRGTIGEIGTGCGVGAAWMADVLAPGASLVTVEVDAERAAAARNLLAAVPAVRVIQGDWRELLVAGPFDLLFADVTAAKTGDPDPLVHALAPGGLLVLDDLTPEELWPAEWRGRPDPVRDSWLNEPRLAATELRVTPASAVILAARVA